MLIVSYYTPDYAEHADRLRKSCAWETHWIEPVEDTGSWVNNCARKAAFVLRALRSQNEDVLWLDADAEIRKPIHKWFDFDEDLDFAVYRDEGQANPKWKFRSGTVWFNQTPAAHTLCEHWARKCEEDPRRFDQESLWLAWVQQDEPRTHWLPMSYCQRIGEPGYKDADAHILHYQASRTLKRKNSFGAPTVGNP